MKIKKAFSLVELLVVVAILAILSGAAILTYQGISSLSEINLDQEYINDVNNCLVNATRVDNVPRTLGEAFSICESRGLNIKDKVPSHKGFEFRYDINRNKFFIFDITKNKINYPENYVEPRKEDTWRVFSDYSSFDGQNAHLYCAYFRKDVVFPSNEIELYLGVEFEGRITAENLAFDYALNDSIILATNGGNIRINSCTGTIRNYGSAEKITIQNSDYTDQKDYPCTFKEYGKINEIDLINGNLEIRAKANVNQISISQDGTGKATLFVSKNCEVGNITDPGNRITE